MLLRHQWVAHMAILVVGFIAPWDRWLPLDGRQKSWLALAAWPALNGWMSFRAATAIVLGLAILCAAAAAWLQILASEGAPRRHLGIWLHTLALAILMPPSGSVFTIVAIGAFELLSMRRNAGSELTSAGVRLSTLR